MWTHTGCQSAAVPLHSNTSILHLPTLASFPLLPALPREQRRAIRRFRLRRRHHRHAQLGGPHRCPAFVTVPVGSSCRSAAAPTARSLLPSRLPILAAFPLPPALPGEQGRPVRRFRLWRRHHRHAQLGGPHRRPLLVLGAAAGCVHLRRARGPAISNQPETPRPQRLKGASKGAAVYSWTTCLRCAQQRVLLQEAPPRRPAGCRVSQGADLG